MAAPDFIKFKPLIPIISKYFLFPNRKFLENTPRLHSIYIKYSWF